MANVCYTSMSDLEIIKALLKKDEQIAPELKSFNYNLNKCVVYDCKGYDLIGSTCNVNDPERHFIVKNNHYRVYEFPAKGGSTGKLRMTGDYIAIFQNLDFGYWTLTTMKHRFHCFYFRSITQNEVGDIINLICVISIVIKVLQAIISRKYHI